MGPKSTLKVYFCDKRTRCTSVEASGDEKLLKTPAKVGPLHLGCSCTERHLICYPCCARDVSCKHDSIVESLVTCFTRRLRCRKDYSERYLRLFFAATPLKMCKIWKPFQLAGSLPLPLCFTKMMSDFIMCC